MESQLSGQFAGQQAQFTLRSAGTGRLSAVGPSPRGLASSQGLAYGCQQRFGEGSAARIQAEAAFVPWTSDLIPKVPDGTAGAALSVRRVEPRLQEYYKETHEAPAWW